MKTNFTSIILLSLFLINCTTMLGNTLTEVTNDGFCLEYSNDNLENNEWINNCLFEYEEAIYCISDSGEVNSEDSYNKINFDETTPTFIMPSGDNVWVLDSLDQFKQKNVSDSTYLSSINYKQFIGPDMEATAIKINANTFAAIKFRNTKED